MDVDEDEDGAQAVRKVADYGIEVDFDALEDEEREVTANRASASLGTDDPRNRTILLKELLNLTQRSQN